MGTGPGRSPRTDRGVRRQSTQQAARTAHRARRAGGPGPHPSSGGERRTRSPGRATDGTGASPAPCGTDRLDQVQLTTWSKPRVERPMPYVRDSFWRGREFTTLEQMEVGAVRWCRDVAGARSFRSLEGAAPAAVFAAVEAGALGPLPTTPFVLATWSTGKVGPDIHVKVGPTLYSVPWRLIGQQVHARSTATMVQLVHEGAVVATHVRRERGRATNVAHYPPEKIAFHMRTPTWCREVAQEVGPACAEVVATLLEINALFRLRAAQGVLGLRDKHTPTRLEAACAKAIAVGDPSYRTIKGILIAGTETTIQAGGPTGVAAGLDGGFGAGDQDALDGAVGRVTHSDCLGARGFQAGRGVFVPQPQDALGGAEPEQRVDLQQGGDDLGTGRADLFGDFPAPGRGAHVERDPLGRIVRHGGGPAPLASHVGGHDLALMNDLDHGRRRAGVDLLANQPPGHRVQRGADLDVDVRADLASRPGRQHERRGRQRPQRRGLYRGEHDARCGAIQRPT